jgi:hypothetical protein
LAWKPIMAFAQHAKNTVAADGGGHPARGLGLAVYALVGHLARRYIHGLAAR